MNLRARDDHRPSVDYDSVARTYQVGRELSDATVRQWRESVSKYLPTRRTTVVLDLGAGTGIYTRAWCEWPGCFAIAIEPSAGMRHQAREADLPDNSVLLAGVGESIGLRDSCTHVAWLSSVLHHLDDVTMCVRELRRVVVEHGVVLVRNVFADRGSIGWLPYFPGSERAQEQFPSVAATAHVFEDCGFALVGEEYMSGKVWTSPLDAATWARAMRHVDSLLTTFSDHEFDRGVRALEAAPQDELLADRVAVLVFK